MTNEWFLKLMRNYGILVILSMLGLILGYKIILGTVTHIVESTKTACGLQDMEVGETINWGGDIYKVSGMDYYSGLKKVVLELTQTK